MSMASDTGEALGAAFPKLPEIPRGRYVDPAFYQQEIDKVFKASWLLVGHASEVPDVGSYLTLDLPFAPVVLVRGKDGEIRSFLNSCRHRGAPVVREKQGCTRSLVCQYHAWTYDLEGNLKGVPQKSDFCGLDLNNYPLQQTRCELWGGLVFINLDADAKPLSEWIAGFGRQYDHIVGAPLKCVSRQSYVIDCNWKIAVEAFLETYHVEMIHKQTAAQVILSHETKLVLHPNGHGVLAPPYRPDLMEISEWKGTALRSTLQPLDGFEFNVGVETPGLFPNAFISFEAPGFPAVIKWPLGVDKTRIDLIWYGRDWGDEEMPAEWNDRVAAFHMLMLEDIENLEPMQRSIAADVGKGVPLCGQERRLYHLHAELDRRIGHENIAPELRIDTTVLDAFIE